LKNENDGYETIKNNAGMSWEKVNFSDVVEFLEGPGVRNWQFQNKGIKLINIRNLVNDKIDLTNTTNHLSNEEVELKYKHFLLNEGDYIIASSGVTWGKIAEVKEEHLPLCLNTSIIKIIPKNNKLLKKYLWFFIKSVSFTSQIEKLITGSAQPNFGPMHLKQIQIPLPPLPIQKRIAEILDAADALKRKDQELLKKYDELAQAIFIDMFGDPVKNEKGWGKIEFGDCIDYIGDIGSNGSNATISKNIEMLDTEDYAIMVKTTNLNANNFEKNLKYVSEKTYTIDRQKLNFHQFDFYIINCQ
jgi:type I restriction enzyme S subunit